MALIRSSIIKSLLWVCIWALCADLNCATPVISHESGRLVSAGECRIFRQKSRAHELHDISVASAYSIHRDETLTIQITLTKTGDTNITMARIKKLVISAMLRWEYPGAEATRDCVAVGVAPFTACIDNFTDTGGRQTCTLPPRHIMIPSGAQKFKAIITAGFKQLLCGAVADRNIASCSDAKRATQCKIFCQSQWMSMHRLGKPMFNFTNPKSRITEEGITLIKARISGPYGWMMYLHDIRDAERKERLAFFHHDGSYPKISGVQDATKCNLPRMNTTRDKWLDNRSSNTVTVACGGSPEGAYEFKLIASSAYGSSTALVRVTGTTVNVFTNSKLSNPLPDQHSISFVIPAHNHARA